MLSPLCVLLMNKGFVERVTSCVNPFPPPLKVSDEEMLGFFVVPPLAPGMINPLGCNALSSDSSR